MTANAEQVRILLVEDGDGDALLVEELLSEAGTGVTVQRARLLADARKLISGAACVLLDLGLPDSQGLDGLLRQEPDVTVVVLTGVADEYLGEEAVRAGGARRCLRARPFRGRAGRLPAGRMAGPSGDLNDAVFSVAAVVAGALALARLDDERQRVETTIDPAALAAQQLYSALLNQETGVRGYALSAQPEFLAPYTQGAADEKAAVTQLRQLDDKADQYIEFAADGAKRMQVSKPVDFENFVAAIRQIDDFFLTLVQLPR